MERVVKDASVSRKIAPSFTDTFVVNKQLNKIGFAAQMRHFAGFSPILRQLCGKENHRLGRIGSLLASVENRYQVTHLNQFFYGQIFEIRPPADTSSRLLLDRASRIADVQLDKMLQLRFLNVTRVHAVSRVSGNALRKSYNGVMLCPARSPFLCDANELV